MQKILIYGSYGYTGNLIAELAKAKGLNVMLAGRNLQKLEEQSQRLNLSFLAFPLEDKEQLHDVLQYSEVVIHCAGPYKFTAKTMLEACIETQTHYTDITGEIEVFEWIASQQPAIQRAGIVALPGAGFDVVPSDCLAKFLSETMPEAVSLELAFKGVGELSRGTAMTMLENVDRGGMIRKNGAMKSVPAAYRIRELTFGTKKNLAVSIPWGDVSTAFYSTGIPNIIVFTAVDGMSLLGIRATNYFGAFLSIGWIKNWLKKKIDQKIKGPNATTRANAKSYLWGKVTNQEGETKEASLVTAEAYWLTAQTALRSAERLLENTLEAGFYTPSKAFGADFILEFEGTERTLL